jgi:hypothetical protein
MFPMTGEVGSPTCKSEMCTICRKGLKSSMIWFSSDASPGFQHVERVSSQLLHDFIF